MVAADPSLFQKPSSLQRKAAQIVVAAMLASEHKLTSPQNPSVLGAEGEGGSGGVPPQRDKQRAKYNLGSSLQEVDQVKVLQMLENNEDRFAFSLEDINPLDFKGEAMEINLNSNKAILRPPHKLGQVEWGVRIYAAPRTCANNNRARVQHYPGTRLIVHMNVRYGRYLVGISDTRLGNLQRTSL